MTITAKVLVHAREGESSEQAIARHLRDRPEDAGCKFQVLFQVELFVVDSATGEPVIDPTTGEPADRAAAEAMGYVIVPKLARVSKETTH
jgi:hypothetical protein